MFIAMLVVIELVTFFYIKAGKITLDGKYIDVRMTQISHLCSVLTASWSIMIRA